MTNRLSDLESHVSRAHQKKAGPTRKPTSGKRQRKPRRTLTRVSNPASPATNGPAPVLANGLSRLVSKWPSRGMGVARAFAGIDYSIPGVFGPLAQPSANSCWATAYTMLVSWRRQQSLSIEDALAIVGRKWVDRFNADTGLPGGEKSEFLTAAGLVAEPPQSWSIEGWEQLLRNYGPIWVTTDEAPGKAWAIHARVIIAIKGDGTPEKTFLTIVDPAGGRQYQESVATFIPKYEEEVIRTGYLRIQVVHWTADARAEVRSLGGGRSRRLARPFTRTTPEYPQASRFVPAASENYRVGTGPRAVERIVIHITDGGPNISGTISWFKNPAARVSAHYVVGQDGEVVQMVAHDDVAWHAGSANSNSIGVEHVANTRGLVPTAAQYCASAALVTWLCDRYGLPLDRAHIVGHSEADPSTTHTGCPNSVWNWEHYMGLVQSRSCYAPGTQPPVVANALSQTAGELARTIDQLRKQGTSDDEIRQFLQQIGTSQAFALGEPQGVTITLPGGYLLTPVQSRLLLAALSSQLAIINPALAPVLMPLFQLLPEVANRFNVTIGVGPSVTGAGVAGASLSAGILFAPGNRIGFYGSLGTVLGAIVSISATMQVTIVKGGPELFGGSALAVSIGGGEGVVGSASALLSQGRCIGVSFAMGVGAGVTPIEAYAQYQYTPTTLGLACARVT